jgi:hypothetical protein
MSWVSRHVVAVAVVLFAVVAMGGVFVFAHPTYKPYVMPPPPDAGLPYTHVSYSAADAKRAFAAVGIEIENHGPRATRSYPMTTLNTKDFTVEVTAFRDAQQVKDSGYSAYYTFVDGHWVHAPRTCSPGARNAERWRGNIRVIVSCSRAGSASSTLLRRAGIALGRL